MKTNVRNVGLAVALFIAAVLYFWPTEKPPPADQQDNLRPSPSAPYTPPLRGSQPAVPDWPARTNPTSPVWPYQDNPATDRSFMGSPYAPSPPPRLQTQQRGWNQGGQWGQPGFSYPYQTSPGFSPDVGGYQFRPLDESRKGKRWTGNFASPSGGGQ